MKLFNGNLSSGIIQNFVLEIATFLATNYLMRANQAKIYRNKYTIEYTFILAVFRGVNNKPGWGATPNDNLKDLLV